MESGNPPPNQNPDSQPFILPTVWCGLCGYMVAKLCIDYNICNNYPHA